MMPRPPATAALSIAAPQSLQVQENNKQTSGAPWRLTNSTTRTTSATLNCRMPNCHRPTSEPAPASDFGDGPWPGALALAESPESFQRGPRSSARSQPAVAALRRRRPVAMAGLSWGRRCRSPPCPATCARIGCGSSFQPGFRPRRPVRASKAGLQSTSSPEGEWRQARCRPRESIELRAPRVPAFTLANSVTTRQIRAEVLVPNCGSNAEDTYLFVVGSTLWLA